ncbi:hypothetical protein LX32DRAFT_643472 [Colletotrichum zoysiae]|uniref:Secreted protein n=1 Tax=Colletotrichum zoysiae TaxID=1216348 RepID=A0AAD9H9J3_9PEZI|nr:hypothetical protein LX32DRAFT_643472 [Colletotrichum zoysiae]
MLFLDPSSLVRFVLLLGFAGSESAPSRRRALGVLGEPRQSQRCFWLSTTLLRRLVTASTRSNFASQLELLPYSNLYHVSAAPYPGTGRACIEITNNLLAHSFSSPSRPSTRPSDNALPSTEPTHMRTMPKVKR